MSNITKRLIIKPLDNEFIYLQINRQTRYFTLGLQILV